MKKGFILLSGLIGFLLMIDDAQCCQNMNINSKYAHHYMNRYRPSMYTNGRYIVRTSGIYYSHSKSKLKRKRHAERIEANNAKMAWY